MSAPHAIPSPTGPNLARDFIAGTVVFLVAIPLCLGIALASGAPLLSGLISGIVGGIVVGLLSGSHVSVSGPAAGLAAIVLSQITSLGTFEAFLLAVFLAGLIQLVFAALKGGAFANYFPGNVIKGLLAAIGILIILKQIPHLVGHDANYEGDFAFAQGDGDNTFTALATAARQFLPGAALVGLSSIALLIVWPWTPLARTLFPAPLAAVLFGVGVSEVLSMSGSSWAIAPSHLVAVPVIGANGMGWSDLVRFPDFTRIAEPAIWVCAITLAIVASLETLLNLEATDKLDPQRRTSPPTRELFAQGVGNGLAGLIGGLPMTSVIVRSSVNAQAGSTTKRAAIFHGVLLLGCVLLVPGLLNRIPLSALAAILIVTGIKLASPKLFRQVWKDGIPQFLPFVSTVVAIVLTDLLTGVIIGMVVSFAFILWSNLHRGFRVIREEHVGGLVHRIELASQATYLSRAKLAETLGGFERGDQVVIDARTSDYVDPEILATVKEFVTDIAPARGVAASLIGFKDRYPLEEIRQYVDWTTREIQAQLTPNRALQLLREGNERFASGRRLNRDLVRQVDATAAGQHPMAVVLSCIDSRSPAEILFDLGIGDIFNVRLAGNVGSEKALGSMEFACKVAGAKLIVVLGHTRCGAVKATCDLVAKGVDAKTATGLTNLGAITDAIAHAVRAETEVRDRRDGGNEDFVDRVAAVNVRNTMAWIEANSPVLAELIRNGSIAIVGAMYDIKTGRVEFLDGGPADRPTARPTAVGANR